MKQVIRPRPRLRKFSLLIFSALISLPVFATTQFGKGCPEKFIATVASVEDVPNENFPKEEVNFQIIQSLKGDLIKSKKIQIVKDGPVHFKSGEIYTIETREKWLCSATLFSKN